MIEPLPPHTMHSGHGADLISSVDEYIIGRMVNRAGWRMGGPRREWSTPDTHLVSGSFNQFSCEWFGKRGQDMATKKRTPKIGARF